MNVIFAGTPEFARVAMQAILDSAHRVVAVLTQPDKPAGRGRKLAASPVKALALANGIEIMQPASLRSDDVAQALRALRPDCMVVAAYGLILPQRILDIPAKGCLNIHASLLPRWRGAAPIQRAIEAGDENSGVCIMQMDAGLDTGAILLQQSCRIAIDETGQSLHDKLARLGADLIVRALDQLQQGPLSATPQPEKGVTYATKLNKREARLDWQQSAASLARKIRAFNPWPVCFCILPAPAQAETANETSRAKRLRILAAEAATRSEQSPTYSAPSPGTIIECDRKNLLVQCGVGRLRILEVQPEGRKAMPVAAFLNATPLKPGLRFE